MSDDKDQLATRDDTKLEALMPLGPVDQIVQAFKMLQELKRKLLTDDDYYVGDQGKRQLKADGWRKLAVSFGLEIHPPMEERYVDKIDGREWVTRVALVVTHPKGRSVPGIGYFSSREIKHVWTDDGRCIYPDVKTHKGEDVICPIEQLVTSRAYTRALKRAVQDMIGPIEPEDEDNEAIPTAGPATPKEAATRTTRPAPETKPTAHAQQTAVIWDYLDHIMGEDLTEHLTMDALGDEIKVSLDEKFVEEYGPAFTHAMKQWGYGVAENENGLTARLKRPKG